MVTPTCCMYAHGHKCLHMCLCMVAHVLLYGCTCAKALRHACTSLWTGRYPGELHDSGSEHSAPCGTQVTHPVSPHLILAVETLYPQCQMSGRVCVLVGGLHEVQRE